MNLAKDIEIKVRGSTHEGSRLARRCIDLIGPPTLTEHGLNGTFIMEFTSDFAEATLTSTDCPGDAGVWQFHLRVAPSGSVTARDWDILRIALAPDRSEK